MPFLYAKSVAELYDEVTAIVPCSLLTARRECTMETG